MRGEVVADHLGMTSPTTDRRGDLAIHTHDLGKRFGQRFHAGVARADEDKGQVALRVRAIGVGELELAQDVVAKVDRVAQALEAEAVLGQAWDRRHARHGAEGEHEPLVVQVARPELGVDGDPASLLVERHGAAAHELGVRAHRAQRDDRAARLERAGGDLRQHGRVEHRAVGADDGRAALAEQARDVGAAEAAAEDEGLVPGHAAYAKGWWKACSARSGATGSSKTTPSRWSQTATDTVSSSALHSSWTSIWSATRWASSRREV